MSDKTAVEIHGGYMFGLWATIGVLTAIGWMFIVFTPIDWVKDYFSSHKARYVITVQAKQGEGHDETFVTDDYDRKLNGQIVFMDCTTANQITLSPSNYKIEVATITDKSSAQVCKVR